MARKGPFAREADTVPDGGRARPAPGVKTRRRRSKEDIEPTSTRWAGSEPPTPRVSKVRAKQPALPAATVGVVVADLSKDPRGEHE
jgi:hypothetical protein